MRNCLIRTALGFLLLASMNPVNADKAGPVMDSLTEYTAVYALRHGNLKAGEATFSLQRNDDNSFSYVSVTQATGLVALFRKDVIKENVRVEVHEDYLRPVQYEYIHENTDKNRNQSIKFDWTEMIAESNNRGNESSHKLHRFTVDRASMPLIVGYALANQSLPKKYVLLDHGKVRNYRMKEAPGKEIKTRAGKFQTVLVQRQINSNDQQLRIWLSPGDNFLPIRIENEEPGGETTSLELLEIKYSQPD